MSYFGTVVFAVDSTGCAYVMLCIRSPCAEAYHFDHPVAYFWEVRAVALLCIAFGALDCGMR
jgi:hypothetical protein